MYEDHRGQVLALSKITGLEETVITTTGKAFPKGTCLQFTLFSSWPHYNLT